MIPRELPDPIDVRLHPWAKDGDILVIHQGKIVNARAASVKQGWAEVYVGSFRGEDMWFRSHGETFVERELPDGFRVHVVDKDGMTDQGRDVFGLCDVCGDAKCPGLVVGYECDPSDFVICEMCVDRMHRAIEYRRRK